jgi:hypothetical protein
MNERIKELARKCGINVDDTFPGGFPNEQVSVVEQFAELIVRECIDQCDDNGSNDEWDRAVRWSANQIKEHFGVE